MGENVDGAVRRLGYAYDDLGRQEVVTSYSDTSGTTVVNQVQYAYDGWGNLIEEWQAHDGAVNTSTTESVQYVYDDGASSGIAKFLRLTDIIYPNGRDVVYGYGSSGSTDDILSRIATIGDGTNVHAAYEYLGTDTIVSEDFEQPEVKLDYAAGNFSALDRFGRVLDQVWSNYSGSPGTRDEYNYAFDRAGNRVQRLNALEAAVDQLYEYDGLNQLVSTERGSGYLQVWELDGLGNWSSFDDDGTVQTRATNAANEITATSGLATPDYDCAGNMIVTPKPGDPANAWDVTFDAWNRVVEVTDGVTTVTYEYDANGRRIQRTVGVTDEHFYYDGAQLVEIREPDGLGGLQPETQYVWSLRYIDSPVLRDRFTSGTIVPGERLFYLTDANHNVTAVVDVDGDVVERYDYDPYGRVTVYDAAWANPASVSAVGNTLLFAGQDVDETTGLQYVRARWYSPVVGGFVSRDPIGFEGGDSNVYRYVGGNPANYTDPLGLQASSSSGGPGGSSSASSGASSGSGGASPITQGANAYWNGASARAIADAAPTGKIGRAATDFGKQWQKSHGGDWGNAARHGYWQAMLTAVHGEQAAKAIGDAHELGVEGSLDSRTDQYNNKVAREIGKAVSPEGVKKAVEEALLDGKFITDQKNDPRVPPKCEDDD